MPMTYTDENLQQDVDYALGCLTHYMGLFPLERISHAHVCEIGPGKNLACGLVFRSLGADRVYMVDKYLKPWDETYHPAFYTLLGKCVKDKWPQADLTFFEQAACGHDGIDGVLALAEDAETLQSIPDNSLDFCFSMAVLEHLFCPPQAFARLAEVTRSGGRGLHQVDFRDHADFSRPLEFLLHYYRWEKEPDEETLAVLAARRDSLVGKGPRESYQPQRLIRSICGYHGNSYRSAEYTALWEKNGFHVLRADCNMFAEDAYLDAFLPRLRAGNSPASAWPRDELRRLDTMYAVEKR